jgi:hypothetical protein
MEIKPLTISGVERAGASWTLYSTAFGPCGISPDMSWLQNGRVVTVTSLGVQYPTFVFNIGGILFYTTNKQDLNDLKDIAAAALGFSASAALDAGAATLVNTITTFGGQGSEVQTINNLVQIGIKGEEAETALDFADAA